MKRLVQKFLEMFGIKIIKAKNVRKQLPKASVDSIEVILRFYQLMKKEITLLQVGACDGQTSDSVHSYIKSGGINGFLVEPSAVNFSKLKSFYENDSNVVLINAAVGVKDELRDFYTVRDEGRWKDSGQAREIASFYKPHLLSHGILENEIAVEKVQSFTISTIVQKYGIANLDVLLIDTEGFDGEVVKIALQQNILPDFIVFENVQLVKNYAQSELNNLYKLLEEAGYVWIHDRINTMAVRRTFFSD
jgi:FkbM family methyltransferase